jgi:hypothetical protein
MRVRASSEGGIAAEAQLPLPGGPEQTAQQALAACRRAFEAGIRRQRVELLLPLIGATDLDDWPGGIQQQFKVTSPLPFSLKLFEGVTRRCFPLRPNKIAVLLFSLTDARTGETC